jgi:hypothetical protein
MKTVTNKTRQPLSVPLPRGKTLHLGPGKTGQVAANAIDFPPFKKLVDEGSITVDEGHGGTGPMGGSRLGPTAGPAPAGGGASRRSGDR